MSFGKGASELLHENIAQSEKSITDEVIELFRAWFSSPMSDLSFRCW